MLELSTSESRNVERSVNNDCNGGDDIVKQRLVPFPQSHPLVSKYYTGNSSARITAETLKDILAVFNCP